MAETTTVARPYAEAAFEVAQGQGRLADWSGTLERAAQVAAHPDMLRLLDNPRVSREQVESVFLEACGDAVDAQAANLVRVLAENRRLALLPEVARLFEKARAEAERTVEAEVVSAQPLDDAARQHLAEALKKRLGREVTLRCEVDESLLGGAVVRAGDLVIDGSAATRLERLRGELAR